LYSKTKPVVLATAQALTGSDAVVGDPGVFDVRNNREVSLYLDWTKASATALELLVESSPVASGDEWYPHPLATDAGAAFASGVVTQAAGTQRFSVEATGKHHLPLRVYGAHRVRFKARETGTADGTLTAKITAVQEAS
jgi:hypothetical protein